MVLDLGGGRDDDEHLGGSGVHPHVVDREHVRGVGRRDEQRPVGQTVEHEHAGAIGDGAGEQAHDVRGGDDAREVDGLQAQVLRQRLGDLALGGVAELGDHDAQPLARAVGRTLHLQGVLRLRLGEQAARR
ncbi:hypothetical protein GCM10025868_12550 [Angustibacter aerolatus]|uniref:Uncharacterized protein n=1 Tax=Angustibacter aerolatus TaxID=1162965 RepID=A0ABQ6JGM8_9ACTN|nr:hypothetical protein GCM10025868_12550 [Angustibacter aerolatus]